VYPAVKQILEDERGNIRFVVAGQSQGGELAQIASPFILNQFGGAIPRFGNNIETIFWLFRIGSVCCRRLRNGRSLQCLGRA
jgi:hypothetical protein